MPELGATLTVAPTARWSRLIMETVSLSVLVTAATPTREETATPVGVVPTVSVAMMLRLFRSIKETVLSPELVTSATSRSGSMATARGEWPTGIACITVKSSALETVPSGLRTSTR